MGGDTELQQLAKTDRNPVQETRYQQLLREQAQGGGATSGATTTTSGAGTDPVALARQIQQFQVQANQPQVQALQTVQQGLPQQYASLLADIKGQGTVAQNYAQRAENTLLGQRGIVDPNSAIYGQEMTGALLPVTQQYGQLAAQVGRGSIQDVNTLAANIAALQAGNPATSLSGAYQLGGLQQQAALLPSQVALTQAQAGQIGTAARYVTIPGVGLYDIQSRQIIQGGLNNMSSGGYQVLGLK